MGLADSTGSYVVGLIATRPTFHVSHKRNITDQPLIYQLDGHNVLLPNFTYSLLLSTRLRANHITKPANINKIKKPVHIFKDRSHNAYFLIYTITFAFCSHLLFESWEIKLKIKLPRTTYRTCLQESS